VISRFLQVPYLALRTSLHKPSSDIPYLHFHLASRAILKHSLSLIPKPPTFTRLHTFFHQATFLTSSPQPQRNFACILLIWLQTAVGALKKENYNKDKALITDFINQIYSIIDSILPFYLGSLALILSTIEFQNIILL